MTSTVTKADKVSFFVTRLYKGSQKTAKLQPYLEAEDIRAALEYAAWRSEESELPLEAA